MTRLLCLLFAHWATFAGADGAAISGATIQALVQQVLDDAGQVGSVQISPNRRFPGCAGPLDVSPHLGSWRALSVSCPHTSVSGPWQRVLRVQDGQAALPGAEGAFQNYDGTQAILLRDSLAKGTVLSAEHLIAGDAPGLRYDGLVTHLHAALGRKLRVNLRAGQALLARHLDHEWKVEKGAPVTLVIRRGGISVATSGHARAPGQLGERVPVRNASSGVVVYGTVTGKNKVEIGPNTPSRLAVYPCGSSKICGKRKHHGRFN